MLIRFSVTARSPKSAGLGELCRRLQRHPRSRGRAPLRRRAAAATGAGLTAGGGGMEGAAAAALPLCAAPPRETGAPGAPASGGGGSRDRAVTRLSIIFRRGAPRQRQTALSLLPQQPVNGPRLSCQSRPSEQSESPVTASLSRQSESPGLSESPESPVRVTRPVRVARVARPSHPACRQSRPSESPGLSESPESPVRVAESPVRVASLTPSPSRL
jgi:hypothetical protein